jgi:hypothetical protein
VGDGLVGHGLVGGHQVFEFFKPVEDDVDSGWLSFIFVCCLDHQKPLTV